MNCLKLPHQYFLVRMTIQKIIGIIMSTTLTFQDRNLDVIKLNGNDWVKGSAICGVLGYKNPEKAISDIYERHKDEFTPSMVQKIRIKTQGGQQEVLAFSLRGAHLLAMFSRTSVATEFRKWVLDVLEENQTSPKLRLEQHPQQQLSHHVSKESLQDARLISEGMYNLLEADLLATSAHAKDVLKKAFGMISNHLS